MRIWAHIQTFVKELIDAWNTDKPLRGVLFPLRSTVDKRTNASFLAIFLIEANQESASDGLASVAHELSTLRSTVSGSG